MCILHPYLKTYSSIFCSEAVGNLSILLDVMKGVNSSICLLAGYIICKSCMMFMFSLLSAASFVVFLFFHAYFILIVLLALFYCHLLLSAMVLVFSLHLCCAMLLSDLHEAIYRPLSVTIVTRHLGSNCLAHEDTSLQFENWIHFLNCGSG